MKHPAPAWLPGLIPLLALTLTSCLGISEDAAPEIRPWVPNWDIPLAYPEMPDLVVSSRMKIRTSPLTGDWLLRPKIANVGTADAPPFDVKGLLTLPNGDVLEITHRWPALPAGSELRSVLNATSIPQVRYTSITLIADPARPAQPGGEVRELIEINNERTFAGSDLDEELDELLGD